MSRTIWVPDYGDSDSRYLPMEIPELHEPGYLTPAQRLAAADPRDPWAKIIAREQAIEEYLDNQAALSEMEADAEPEAEL